MRPAIDPGAAILLRRVVGHCHGLDRRHRAKPDLVAAGETNRISYAQRPSPRAMAASEILERRFEAADNDACVMAREGRQRNLQVGVGGAADHRNALAQTTQRGSED